MGAREDDDAATIESALDDIAHAVSQGRDRNLIFLVDLLRFRQLNFGAGQFHFDDIRAELGGNLSAIGHYVYGGLALFAQATAAWIGPGHYSQASLLGFFREIPQLLVHFCALS